jgi:hypothetical protein
MLQRLRAILDDLLFQPLTQIHGTAKVRTRYTVECFDARGTLKWAAGFFNLVVTEGLNLLLNRSFDAIAADVNWYVGMIGAHSGTVSITTGTNSITGSGTSFTSADVGSDIIIVGAGAAGADLVTTVASVTNGTTATTTANAGTTVSGASYAIEPRPADTMASHAGFTEVTPYSNANRPTWTKNGTASAGAMSNSSSKASFTINATSRVFGAFMSTNNTKGGTTVSLYGGGLFSTGSRSILSGDTVNVQSDLSVTAS